MAYSVRPCPQADLVRAPADPSPFGFGRGWRGRAGLEAGTQWPTWLLAQFPDAAQRAPLLEQAAQAPAPLQFGHLAGRPEVSGGAPWWRHPRARPVPPVCRCVLLHRPPWVRAREAEGRGLPRTPSDGEHGFQPLSNLTSSPLCPEGPCCQAAPVTSLQSQRSEVSSIPHPRRRRLRPLCVDARVHVVLGLLQAFGRFPHSENLSRVRDVSCQGHVGLDQTQAKGPRAQKGGDSMPVGRGPADKPSSVPPPLPPPPVRLCGREVAQRVAGTMTRVFQSALRWGLPPGPCCLPVPSRTPPSACPSVCPCPNLFFFFFYLSLADTQRHIRSRNMT